MNQLAVDKSLIYQCTSSDISTGGGLETYISSLVKSGLPEISSHVIKSLKGIGQSQFKLLHIHSKALLKEVTGECPSIFTAHNHSLHCPSGTKYLPTSGVCCDRSISVLGCTWGKLVDGCGSRRPHKIINSILLSYELIERVRKHRVIVIANSNYIREQLIKNGLPPEQTVTLHCGISIPKIPGEPLTLETHENQRILFAGRIVPDKGLEWLLKSLSKTNQQIHLDIAGEGWERPRLEKLVNQLGLNKRVTWHGWCNHESMDMLYRECFAVVFPSVWPEPAGLITLEACARYRPVIASAVGGIPEYLRDGETGILVPGNDIRQLADAITELSTNYPKSRHLGERGHTLFLKEFTMDVHICKLQKIYERAIDNFHLQRFHLMNKV